MDVAELRLQCGYFETKNEHWRWPAAGKGTDGNNNNNKPMKHWKTHATQIYLLNVLNFFMYKE